MKTHAIIPIFIPHLGCPYSCVFCNQNIITARSKAPTPEDVRRTIEEHLKTLRGRGLKEIEIAFYGGSFTAIPMQMQNAYLDAALPYIKSGDADGIHLSTRPDCIDDDILSNLEEHSVSVIELGVQSFVDDVLEVSKRGHTARDAENACRLIKSYGFALGIQLMIGLPKDTAEKSIESAMRTAKLKPELARIYPTVTLPGTELADMLGRGEYRPPSENEAIETAARMYEILMDAGITIMRVGLKSTDLMTNDGDLSHGYHPAFRQLVEGKIMRGRIETRLCEIGIGASDRIVDPAGQKAAVTCFSNDRWFNSMIGHKAENKRYFEGMGYQISFKKNDDLPDAAIDIVLE